MNHCYIKFRAASSDALSRAGRALDVLAAMKSGQRAIDEAAVTALLSKQEMAYFSNFTPEEWQEWNEHWQKTPVAVRTSAAMVTPQWDIGSMYEAFWNGEYDLIGILEEGDGHCFAFEPHSYPFGGTSCMVAFIECFGHAIVGIEDGTGYREYERRTIWRPKSSKAEA